jgi:hypothetical protein
MRFYSGFLARKAMVHPQHERAASRAENYTIQRRVLFIGLFL